MNPEKLSVRLAYMLRHSRDPLYVSLEGGWAEVETVLDALRLLDPSVTRETLDAIVARDRKTRYSFDPTGTRIRANQGHSIPGVKVEMISPAPPEYLYHGTADRFLPAILREGLKPMSRQFVHMSGDYPTALAVGSRHGRPVVLLVHAGKLAADGHSLFLSANGVWQAGAVPPEYLSLIPREPPAGSENSEKAAFDT